MALRKLAGPFEYRDLFGDYRSTYLGPWFDELDGFLANSFWRQTPTASSGVYGRGIVQLDGVLTPRASIPTAGGWASGPSYQFRYDWVTRRVSFFDAGYTASPDPSGYSLTIYRGVDWFTLKTPYEPETVSLTFTADGVHTIWPYAFALLTDRVIFLGKVTPGQFSPDPRVYKFFAVPYTSGPFVAPIEEHSFQTEKVPGSGVWDNWDFTTFDKIIPSATPERSVFLVKANSLESRALEYDFIQKKVVGWVRRLGATPGLNPSQSSQVTHLAAYAGRHKVWAVEDSEQVVSETTDAEGNIYYDYRRRMWLFADAATPATLSNPVALSPTRSGEAVRYRVQLLSVDYEPCIGHRVNWSCSALGTVLIPQSVTDENGYAETKVAYPPRQDGPVEGTTITAEVVF